MIPGYAAAVADSGTGHRHDTIVLGQPGWQQPESAGWTGPPPSGPPALPAGWGPPPTWSSGSPFPTGMPPVIARNNAAVVGATLGSVSLFLAFLPVIGIVAWVLAPVGLLSSGVGLIVGMRRRVGRVGALWGLATSGIALLICLAWVALLLAI